jgi:serine/threonine protein phosphatase PrpC
MAADGTEGQGYGRTASRFAVQSLVEHMSDSPCLQQRSLEALLSLLSVGIQHANRVVYERNQQRQTVMVTTLTAALVIEVVMQKNLRRMLRT